MKQIIIYPLFLLNVCAVFILNKPASAAMRPTGTLVVTVRDDAGLSTPAARIYIYGKNFHSLIDGQDIRGSATFTLPADTYRVYAAATRQKNDYVDHVASHELSIEVTKDASVSAILTLEPREEPIVYLSDSVQEKLKLDPKLVRNLN